MKVNGYWLLIFVFILVGKIEAQTIPEIKNSKNYYWGEGKGNSLEDADRNALKDLISQISVQIEYSMKMVWTEDDQDLKQFTESVTKTYSAATLNRAERKVSETDKGTIVLRYITRTQMDEVFSDRKNKIVDYVKMAAIAEKDYRIGSALKYYYWSLALLRSHPDAARIKFDIFGNGEILLLTALPDRINSILGLINAETTGIDENANSKNIMLQFKYKDNLVQDFDFTYWEGDTWSGQNAVKNGLGYIELAGEASKSLMELRIRSEYIFRNGSRIDPEMQNVIENTNIPYFKNAELKIPIKQVAKGNNVVKTNEVRNTNTVGLLVKPDEYVTIIGKISEMINKQNIAGAKSLFTPDGFILFSKLMNYGKVKVLEQNESLKAIKLNQTVYVRSVPMAFSFKTNNRNFVEQVVFEFDSLNLVTSVSFSLGDKAINDILQKSERFASPENKFQIINFMEDYKTAYCLGRIDYLEQVFADNALIIVGNVLKPENKPLDNVYLSLGEQNVKYIRYSKKEYIEKLKNTFSRNEFINIQFDESSIKKPNADQQVYGIQIAQNWYSSTYADKGYLFLMFDLEDVSKPKIYVRTWQPEKSAEGSIYGVTDFNF